MSAGEGIVHSEKWVWIEDVNFDARRLRCFPRRVGLSVKCIYSQEALSLLINRAIQIKTPPRDVPLGGVLLIYSVCPSQASMPPAMFVTSKPSSAIISCARPLLPPERQTRI